MSEPTIRLEYYTEGRNAWQYKYWYKGDTKHRLDGPAREWSDGMKSWWIEGENLTEEQFNERTKDHY